MNKKLPYILALVVSLLILFPSCFLEDLFDPEPELGTANITSTKISRTFNQVWAIELWWDWLDGANAYELWRSEEAYAFQEIGGWTTDQYFIDYGYGLTPEGLKPGFTYEYKVGGHFPDGGFGPLGGVVAVTIPAFIPPENLTVTLSQDGNSALLDWDPVEAMLNYEIYHAENIDGPYSEIGTVQDSLFLDSSSTFDAGTTHYYKVRATSMSYGETNFSEIVPLIISGPPPATEAWHDLGSAGFAFAEGEIELAATGGYLYALFADAADSESKQRIKAMRHDESDTGGWTVAGDYLSLAAADGDEVATLVSGGTLYAAYADTDASVVSGGSPALFVKQFSGTAWTPVGAADGLTTYDPGIPAELGVWGSDPALTDGATGPFIAYITDSGGIVNTLSYPGSGDFWDEEDSDYWSLDPLNPPFPITAAELGLATDTMGRHIAALQSGGGTSNPTVETYRFDGGLWAPHSSNTFSIGTEDGFLDTLGFLCDSSDTLYIAAEKISSGGQEACDIYTSTGSAWGSLNLSAQITSLSTYLDLAIVLNGAGTGIFAAASYQHTDNSFKVELWEYSGSSWQQIGAAVDSVEGALSVDVALDSTSRPILILADGASGTLRALVYRE